MPRYDLYPLNRIPVYQVERRYYNYGLSSWMYDITLGYDLAYDVAESWLYAFRNEQTHIYKFKMRLQPENIVTY